MSIDDSSFRNSDECPDDILSDRANDFIPVWYDSSRFTSSTNSPGAKLIETALGSSIADSQLVSFIDQALVSNKGISGMADGKVISIRNFLISLLKNGIRGEAILRRRIKSAGFKIDES